MPGSLTPLFSQTQLVKPDGTPTDFFIRWALEKQIDIGESITTEQAQQLIDDWAAARTINAGVGLDGGGSLAADITIDLANTAVVPGTYGDATHVGQFTVDQQGRITGATNVPVSGGGGGGSKPTIVQSATARSAASSTASLNLVFPANTTVGNSVVFLVAGYGGTTTKWSIANQGFYIEAFWNTPVTNQGTGVLGVAVDVATNSYTLNIANPNGAVNVLALELSNLASIILQTQVPKLVTKTLTGPLFIDPGFLSYLLSESDANAGAIVSATAGLTLAYDANSAVGHSATFHEIADSLAGQTAAITFTNVPSSPVYTTVVLKGR